MSQRRPPVMMNMNEIKGFTAMEWMTVDAVIDLLPALGRRFLQDAVSCMSTTSQPKALQASRHFARREAIRRGSGLSVWASARSVENAWVGPGSGKDDGLDCS